MDKAALRKEIRAKKKAMTEAEICEKSKNLCRKFL
jgi:5-formyltetrahydrofolate cyclo-ligase